MSKASGIRSMVFDFSSSRRHTRCALVTGVQTCARPISEALAVKIAGETIADTVRRPVDQAYEWAVGLAEKLTNQQRQIAERILKEIIERVGFLNNVGLEYLNLDRTSGTLSGGESQRIRLASQIGSGLSGVLSVLDEPSIGLHQRDNEIGRHTSELQ